MRMVDIIAKKRDGLWLNKEEISFFVHGYAMGKIPDYQVSALLMAIYLKGMEDAEIVNLTLELASLGERANLSAIEGPVVDKHSTGGVGDKTTLVALPIAASVGVKVGKMAGRGLGHTGGTMDRLEAIPGYRTSMRPEEFAQAIKNVGVSIIGHSGRLAPADKKLYMLRDATATVGSPALVAASVMSKKIVSGVSCVILDVKAGNGAFAKTPQEGARLARSLVRLGKALGIKTAALVTNMDVPLGRTVGNTLEVLEAVNTLRGKGPKDVTLLSIEIAANMQAIAGGQDIQTCRRQCREALESGAAYAKLLEMVEAHGGDVSYLTHPQHLPKAPIAHVVKAPKSGYIQRMDCKEIGVASMMLGAGREVKEAPIDYTAGVVLLKKTGESVVAGEPIARFYTARADSVAGAEKIYLPAVTIGEEPPEKQLLVYGKVDGSTLDVEKTAAQE